MPSLEHLVTGYRTFKATTFAQKKDMIMHSMRLGIKPTTLCITCCDLRIAPDALTNSNPGELYTVRNMGGFVPPYESTGASGVISAIEYAVSQLKVENVIVMSHDHCDGIHTLLNYEKEPEKTIDPMGNWLGVAKEAKEAVQKQLAEKTEEEKEKALEQETVLVSLKNLLTYPWVKEGIEQKKLLIYGMHFDVEEGELTCFNPTKRVFEPLT